MVKQLGKKAFVPAILITLVLSPAAWLHADETRSGAAGATDNSATNSVAPTATAPAKHQITGAELYSIHCNRCHSERYPTERTGAQWKTIMLHMQVRANIPVSQARLILQYLEENSGR